MSTIIDGSLGVTFPSGVDQTDAGVGYGQTWQSVTRTSGTTYTNTTGKPIFVALDVSITTTSTLTVVVGGVTIYSVSQTTAVTAFTASFIVPNGVSYTITATNVGSFNVSELR